MSEITSQAPVRPTFDRRSVVKGAAWSVPVIAAAVAAPLAAASERTATVSFAAVPTTNTTTFVRVTQETVSGQDRKGKASPSFTLQNTPGAITGPIRGTFTITPDAVATEAGVGITSLTALGTTFSGAFSGTTYSGSFTHTGTIEGGASVVFSLGGFRYTGTKIAAGGTYTMIVTLAFSGGRTISASSTITLV